MVIALAPLALAGTIAFLPDVTLHPGTVHLSEVADLSALPPAVRDEASSLPLVRVERGAVEVRVTHERLAAAARARMPMLAAWLAPVQPGEVVMRAALRPLTPVVRLRLGQALARGDKVVVEIAAGLVRIEREGTVLDASTAPVILVRTADHGLIRAIRIEAEA